MPYLLDIFLLYYRLLYKYLCRYYNYSFVLAYNTTTLVSVKSSAKRIISIYSIYYSTYSIYYSTYSTYSSLLILAASCYLSAYIAIRLRA
jgi:hypothetical protein